MSERWRTPAEVFDPLYDEFRFDLDAAADEELSRVSTYQKDALNLADWPGQRIWCNPPYGRKLELFVRRCAKEAARHPDIIVVALIPFRCRAAWWHEAIIGVAREVRCVRKRIKFLRPDNTRGKFTGTCDSCVVIWRGRGTGETILTSFHQKDVP
jgi:phage N-6-adenine-methyltransferase